MTRNAATAILALGLSLAAPLVQAASRTPGGCQLLQDRGSVTCMAKVSCRESAAAIAQIRPLFAQCAAGQKLSLRAAEAAIGTFENDLIFQCCIGNELTRDLTRSPLRQISE